MIIHFLIPYLPPVNSNGIFGKPRPILRRNQPGPSGANRQIPQRPQIPARPIVRPPMPTRLSSAQEINRYFASRNIQASIRDRLQAEGIDGHFLITLTKEDLRLINFTLREILIIWPIIDEIKRAAVEDSSDSD